MLGSNFLSELWVQLYLRGLITASWLEHPRSELRATMDTKRGLHSWIDVPSVLRVTLAVPCNKLNIFTADLHERIKLGPPDIVCHLESSDAHTGNPFHNMYAAVHMTFGEVLPHGQRNTSGYGMTITPDDKGWQGRSPLVVSFWAPTANLLLGAEHETVAFGLQSTPQNISLFNNKLGPLLKVFGTRLEDERHVFITRDLPHEPDEAMPQASIKQPVQAKGHEELQPPAVMAHLNEQGELKSLTGRWNVSHNELLANQAPSPPVASALSRLQSTSVILEQPRSKN